MIKPAIPRRFQILLRRKLVCYKQKKYADLWPIDPNAAKIPSTWTGWLHNKKFALILSHDVDTQKGHDRCYKLAELEESLGFRSSFNFVPERYEVSESLRKVLISRGFEVGVHGLKHDGRLFSSKHVFTKRAACINQYLKEWEAVGFRSPAMHHNLKWIQQLNIEYDASTFDTDPFEPQSDGVKTIFPFWVQGNTVHNGYVELPYTLPQDFTLFILLKEKNIDIWKQKLDWIVDKGGMALVNVHPDYMNFSGSALTQEEYPAKYYSDFLEYIIEIYDGGYWNVLPKDMAFFIRTKAEENKKQFKSVKNTPSKSNVD